MPVTDYIPNTLLPNTPVFFANGVAAGATALIAATEFLSDGFSLTFAVSALSTLGLAFTAANQAMQDMPRQVVMGYAGKLFNQVKEASGSMPAQKSAVDNSELRKPKAN